MCNGINLALHLGKYMEVGRDWIVMANENATVGRNSYGGKKTLKYLSS